MRFEHQTISNLSDLLLQKCSEENWELVTVILESNGTHTGYFKREQETRIETTAVCDMSGPLDYPSHKKPTHLGIPFDNLVKPQLPKIDAICVGLQLMYVVKTRSGYHLKLTDSHPSKQWHKSVEQASHFITKDAAEGEAVYYSDAFVIHVWVAHIDAPIDADTKALREQLHSNQLYND